MFRAAWTTVSSTTRTTRRMSQRWTSPSPRWRPLWTRPFSRRTCKFSTPTSPSPTRCLNKLPKKKTPTMTATTLPTLKWSTRPAKAVRTPLKIPPISPKTTNRTGLSMKAVFWMMKTSRWFWLPGVKAQLMIWTILILSPNQGPSILPSSTSRGTTSCSSSRRSDLNTDTLVSYSKLICNF